MKDLKELLHESFSKDAISELMLAKMALEEKNDIIDEKDRIIRELRLREAVMKEEIESIRIMLASYTNRLDMEHEKDLKEGASKVIEDIVPILADYDNVPSFSIEDKKDIDSRLAKRLIKLLEESYGLEIIDGPSERINPEVHEVLEVVSTPGDESSIIQLSRGYKIGKKIIRPVRLKVINGGKGNSNQREDSLHSQPKLVLVNTASKSNPDPKEVA